MISEFLLESKGGRVGLYAGGGAKFQPVPEISVPEIQVAPGMGSGGIEEGVESESDRTLSQTLDAQCLKRTLA